ncbi:hypothetical protein [Thermodesulfovibrio yellowstonii]|jgi:hypothetical protein|uniref:Uncharacterized protein n=1 Tax=Thermodesulfovibrio yellowstonii (strain ATCC 51303 / DSM 11347 / YP87) TaxID=289376 RepID=B5YII6_THEYD|nr:hypothetical protein [Thermodesulfovibrio yellowstonii]ACI21062.1 hypothetical protein THEYE_A0297 [Thermodesulfovibrio yellowstonii DSM 11347]
MIPTKEQLAARLVALALTGLAAGYGVSELDKLAESKHMQEVTKQAVEILKQPEKAFQSQQAQRQVDTTKLIDFTKPFQYELPKPLVMEDLCQYYPAMQQCKDKAIAKKGEEKDEKAEN